MKRLHCVAILAAGCLASAAAIFVAGGIAGELALHPSRRAVPVCPAFDRSRCTVVGIVARDGIRLKAWYFQPEFPNGAAIIALHGVAASREDAAGLASLFLRSGYSALTPDLRGNAESGGIESYGVADADDVHRWADWLFRSGSVNRLYGIGESLGGSILLQSLGSEPRFRAVIAESPYLDFPFIARERVRRALPPGSGWLALPLVFSGLTWTRWRYGVDLRQTSSSDAVRRSLVPVLLIHGLADNLTSPENSRRIAAANPAIELWLVPGAGHTSAWHASPHEFESRVLNWFAGH